MINKMDQLALFYETLQDGTLAVKATDTLMLVPQDRYKELLRIEALYNAIQEGFGEKQYVLEQERKNLKKQNDELANDIKKLKQRNAVLQKKLTENNCIVDEMKELRSQNTELLIELSKFTVFSKETLSGPLKSMIRDLREQGVGIKEIHIRIKRQINPDISYSMVRKYISELESKNKE
ncbi:hypothetical protein AEA09_09950 [Lysinibacillus contaminans]|uniref:Uncharacterized protein n=1 Tax=Lysinibacillus contaminans TaxID=1293441 RepID=A0ABR5K262_9BACI|nr:hypothetical protein [Lysinibacillus contaminans]KOS68830.1 hypothetical protein AEA09_09950 [Lysinibacillus contaminans]